MEGEVYILTDHQVLLDLALQHKVKSIEVPETKNMMEIKSLKAKIFEYLPAKVNSALYIDVDIVIAKQMQSFLNEVSVQLANAKSTQKALDLGAFYDGKGHYVGWCSGCEKWHTGVLLLFRESGGECLEAWGTPFYRDIFLQTRNHLMMPNLREAASRYYRLALLTCCLQRTTSPWR